MDDLYSIWIMKEGQPMKKYVSMILAVFMMMLCCLSGIAMAADTSDGMTVEQVNAKDLAASYLTEWFSDKLAEHYTLYNYDFTFSNVTTTNDILDAYGYLEVDHHLRYQSIDDLPYVKGVMDTLGIYSMEAVVCGDITQLQTAITKAPVLGRTTVPLNDDQVLFLASELKEQYSAVQEDMGDFNASYFFHIVADFDGSNLSNATVTLEAEDIGYLPAEECLPGTAAELYDDGADEAVEFALMALSYDKSKTSNPALPLTYANYDRIAARDYALQYAKNPTESCNCGTLKYNSASSFPDGVTYSAWNNSEYPYFSVFCHNDCANFVSQAMSAGNLPEGGTWFRTKNVSTQSWGRSWTSVSNLKSYMTSNGYWSADKYSTCNAGNILLTSSSHVTMITLNNTVSHCYTGHTNDRRNVSFSDKAGYLYYAINLV